MAVTSDDIAEPIIFCDPAVETACAGADVAFGGQLLLGYMERAFAKAAAGQLVIFAFPANDEQKEVVRLMIQSARQALDLRNQIEAAVGKIAPPQMSAEELEQQRVSFAYGNVAMDNPDVTKQDVIDAAERMKEVSSEG